MLVSTQSTNWIVQCTQRPLMPATITYDIAMGGSSTAVIRKLMCELDLCQGTAKEAK